MYLPTVRGETRIDTARLDASLHILGELFAENQVFDANRCGGA